MEIFILSKIPFRYREEMYGIATQLNRTVGEVLLLNIFYDLLASNDSNNLLPFESSSIIFQDNTTSLYHLTKFDYHFKNLIKNMTFIVNFNQNGNLLFTSHHYGGFIGVMSGVKANKFTISLNSRAKGHQIDNMKYIFHHQFNSISLTIRAIFEYENSFEDAMLVISETPYAAPASFTLTGTKCHQGIVVMSDRYKTLAIKYINESRYKFLLSNEEENPSKISIILSKINYNMINSLGNTTSKDFLYKIFESKLNLEKNSTNIFQTIMSSNILNLIYNYSKFMEEE
uniref:N-acylethanolamine-hydrolyzing acid amidase (inferred by orthology to a human protein) n=1 Tax=Strongyloides venezuelensis TaxID=75913 RepID=A0A0K0FUB3_STRVS